MTPMIRASYTKLGLRHFKRAYPLTWNALTRRIGDDTLAGIREASSLTLLPARIHASVADSLIATVGAREARHAWRDVMVDSFERSLLRPLVSGALAIHGKKPSSIMRMTPQGWSLVWRDCGRAWMEERSAESATMRFEALPAVITGSAGILDSFAANCEAAITYLRLTGTVTMDRAALSKGELDIDVDWHR